MNAITARGAGTLAQTEIEAAFISAVDAMPKTKETYRRAVRRWFAWLKASDIHPFEATRAHVIAYKEAAAKSKSAATVNAYLTAVRAFYAWAESERIYPNIAANVRGLRSNRRNAKECLTADQARAITAQHGEGLQALRDAAMLTLMTRRGLRTIEVVRADIGDLQQVNGQAVLWLQGKGYESKGDFVILNEACLKPIYAYLEARGVSDPSAPLFAGIGNRNAEGRMTTRTVSRIAKEAMRREGISSAKLTAHSLRHTAVTFALLGGASLQETQAMARHKDINTTLVYAHNLQRMASNAESKADAYMDGSGTQRTTQSGTFSA